MTIAVTDTHKQLASAQPLTLRVFADVFAKVQGTAEPTLLEALAPGQPEDVQVEVGFAWADGKGLLSDLAERILRQAPTPAFQQACLRTGLATPSELQSIVDATKGQIDPVIHAENLSSGSEQVCMVLIDGRPKGTGFLVGPTLVATAFHVVDSLLNEKVQGTYVEKNGSHASLSFAFGNYLVRLAGSTQPATPRLYPAHERWLEAYSPVHQAERRGQVPDPRSGYEGYYDFALCRLATMVGIGLQGLKIEENISLGKDSMPISVLQHALAMPLSYQRDAAAPADAPRYRVEHKINTAPGSSGAPCLTDEWHVIAMHQAGANNGPLMGAQEKANRCVPISWTAHMIAAAQMNDVGLLPVAALDDGTRIIGRSAVSGWIFDSLNKPNEPHIFAVIGKNRRGKSITARILRTLLPIADHKVVVLNTCDFEGLDAEDALTILWEACGFPIDELPMDDMPVTTKTAFIRHKVVRAFLERLLDKKGPKSTWIVLDDYNDDCLDRAPGGSWDLINHLMRKAGPLSGLRFILLGYEATSSAVGAGLNVRSETLAPPTDKDFEVYMRLLGMSTQQEPVMQVLRGLFNQLVQLLPFDLNFYNVLHNVLLNGKVDR